MVKGWSLPYLLIWCLLQILAKFKTSSAKILILGPIWWERSWMADLVVLAQVLSSKLPMSLYLLKQSWLSLFHLAPEKLNLYAWVLSTQLLSVNLMKLWKEKSGHSKAVLFKNPWSKVEEGSLPVGHCNIISLWKMSLPPRWQTSGFSITHHLQLLDVSMNQDFLNFMANLSKS